MFALLWMFLDEVKRLRTPTVEFRASRDGFNLQNMYLICENHTNTYKDAIILIKTIQGAIFGVYLDIVPS